jgi:hypothetical protein
MVDDIIQCAQHHCVLPQYSHSAFSDLVSIHFSLPCSPPDQVPSASHAYQPTLHLPKFLANIQSGPLFTSTSHLLHPLGHLSNSWKCSCTFNPYHMRLQPVLASCFSLDTCLELEPSDILQSSKNNSHT